MKDSETLRLDVLAIRADLRNGKLSNAVARTLLYGAKVAIDTWKIEIEASRLGCDIQPLPVEGVTGLRRAA